MDKLGGTVSYKRCFEVHKNYPLPPFAFGQGRRQVRQEDKL